MRFLPFFSSLAIIVFSAVPATAQAGNADTYQAVISKGVIIVTPDMEIDVTFTPDGKFTAFGGVSTGTWHIDGDKLCSKPNETPGIETCAIYPAGRKSGDTFEVKAAGAPSVTIRIR